MSDPNGNANGVPETVAAPQAPAAETPQPESSVPEETKPAGDEAPVNHEETSSADLAEEHDEE
jgi:hypothetical protein